MHLRFRVVVDEIYYTRSLGYTSLFVMQFENSCEFSMNMFTFENYLDRDTVSISTRLSNLGEVTKVLQTLSVMFGSNFKF